MTRAGKRKLDQQSLQIVLHNKSKKPELRITIPEVESCEIMENRNMIVPHQASSSASATAPVHESEREVYHRRLAEYAHWLRIAYGEDESYKLSPMDSFMMALQKICNEYMDFLNRNQTTKHVFMSKLMCYYEVGLVHKDIMFCYNKMLKS